jgi:hypothetical protein
MSSSLGRAQVMGFTAAAFGVIAGAAQLFAGTTPWTGNKNDPVTLGWVTLLLAALLGMASAAVPRVTTSDRGLAVASTLLLAALLGLTTAGPAWVPAAVAGSGAAGFTVHAAGAGAVRASIGRNWPRMLLVVLALIYLALGLTYFGPVGMLGVGGAIAVLAAVVLRTRSHAGAVVLLIVGAVPFAAATYWSLVTPITCLLMMTMGLYVLRGDPTQPATVGGL